MSADRRVTVILPTISIDRLLDQAVDSVLGGELRDLTLIIVHDGVTPDSSRRWMSDPRVEVIHIPQRSGLVNALSMAMSRVQTEYVARLDADDINLPSRLGAQLAYLDTHQDAVMVAGRVMRIDYSGRPLGELFEDITGDDVRLRLVDRNVIAHSAVMFRRSSYVAAGGFNIRLPQMEDYDLWLRMGMIGKIASLDEFVLSYRLHPGQVSRAAKPYGNYIRSVNSARRRLSAALGRGHLYSALATIRWNAAQYLRYYRLRRPGYDRGV